MSGVTHLEVKANDVGQRLDNFLIGHHRSVPKVWFYKQMRKGWIRVNGKRVKPTYRLKEGDAVRLPPLQVEKRAWQPNDVEWMRSCILYENEAYVVINKPNGPSQLGSRQSISVIDGMKALGLSERLYLAHRLDRRTSGCLVLAKNREAMHAMQSAFQSKLVKKTYWALLEGKVNSQIVEAPLMKKGYQVCITSEGKSAITAFKSVIQTDVGTLCVVRPKTGRMRKFVRMRWYWSSTGGRSSLSAKRQKINFLHARAIEWHAMGERIKVKAPVPDAACHRLNECFGEDWLSHLS